MKLLLRIVGLISFVFIWAEDSVAQKKIVMFFSNGEDVRSIAKEWVYESVKESASSNKNFIMVENRDNLSYQQQLDFINEKKIDLALLTNIEFTGSNFQLTFNLWENGRISKEEKVTTQKGYADLKDVARETTGKILSNISIQTVKAEPQKAPTANPEKEQAESPSSRKDNKEQVQNDSPSAPLQNVDNASGKNQASNYTGCGIEVMTKDLPGKYKWKNAMHACPQGWRLPTSKELECICENKNIIGEFLGRQYWSSDTKRDDNAISRTANDCESESEDMDDEYSCRCVRDIR